VKLSFLLKEEKFCVALKRVSLEIKLLPVKVGSVKTYFGAYSGKYLSIDLVAVIELFLTSWGFSF